MAQNLVRTNAAGTIASTSVATVNTIPERDSNGDCNFRRVVGDNAVQSSGCLAQGYATKTADYTPTTEANGLITVTVGAANKTVTLPPAATLIGMMIEVKRLDNTEFTLLVDGNGSETIDGQASVYVNAQYESARFLSDGSNWHEISRKVPFSVVSKSAAFTALGAHVFNVTVGAGGVTATLPLAAFMKGQSLVFTKVDAGAGAFVLDGNGAETVNGAATLTLTTGQYTSTEIFSDGTQWFTVQK